MNVDPSKAINSGVESDSKTYKISSLVDHIIPWFSPESMDCRAIPDIAYENIFPLVVATANYASELLKSQPVISSLTLTSVVIGSP